MTLVDTSNTLKGRLNAAQPNSLADLLRAVGLGDILRVMHTFLRNKAPDATLNPYVIQAAAQSITLPDDAKASVIANAYARGGTGTKGPLTVDVTTNAAPAAGHIMISPNGDIITASADAWTILDIDYRPNKYDVIERTLPVAADLLAFPADIVAKGVLFLLEAEATAGGLKGKNVVQIPAAAKPATTCASLVLAKTGVQFAVADAVTQARVKVAVTSAIDVDAKLTAPADFL